MGIKENIFSFAGISIFLLHLVFMVGVVGVLGLGAWVWTGENPIKSHVRYQDQKEAVQYLIDTNPGYTVDLTPKKKGG